MDFEIENEFPTQLLTLDGMPLRYVYIDQIPLGTLVSIEWDVTSIGIVIGHKVNSTAKTVRVLWSKPPVAFWFLSEKWVGGVVWWYHAIHHDSDSWWDVGGRRSDGRTELDQKRCCSNSSVKRWTNYVWSPGIGFQRYVQEFGNVSFS